ncbi:hypothetical protein [Candidatus Uabimicrobium amorphum]|uniref:DUF4384 domain-containing protein n=1 Tax=Uabimicrobium amorphum TaxID=2596890 RepID=A0A5S9F6D5_UABAM|nr:hypothetical protein [Candidatus Uabimicrobium amorphum]BBM87271.1 hypothetical protein UABAM_05674 [Candidatus Uabimicrobium amorphum]
MRTLILFTIFLSFAYSENGIKITVIGEGTTRKGQLVDAYKKALQRVVSKKIAADIIIAHKSAIDNYINQNWDKYWIRDMRKKYLDARRTKVQTVVHSKLLLKDIYKRIPEIRIRQKLHGIKIAVVINPERESSSFSSSEMMISQMRDKLGKHFHILDQQSAKKLRRMETKAFSLGGVRNYRANIWREFDEISIIMDFAITYERKHDEALGHKINHVNIFSRGIQRMTAQQLFHFEHSIVGNNLDLTVQKCCAAVVQKIIDKMALRYTILPPNVYELKFIHFTKASDRRKIRQALLNLKNDKFLYILKGGTGAGQNYFTHKIRWRKTQHSLPEIIEAVREYCTKLEIQSNYHNARVIFFQPPGSDWDGASDDTEDTSLEKNIIPRSPKYDSFLQLQQQKFVLKHDERFTVEFRWPQHAPQEWYFYAMYFANNEMVYLIFPNGNTRNKLLIPGKDYIFPDVDEYLEEWGIELFATLPQHFSTDKDQVLLLATAKPIHLFSKKLTKLEEGGVAAVAWSEIEELREELQNIKEYAHTVVDIEIVK